MKINNENMKNNEINEIMIMKNENNEKKKK